MDYYDIIDGNRIQLVPYLKEHVSQYHSWLEDPEIQEMTETSGCSLDEEFDYQTEWQLDNFQTKLIKLIQVKDADTLIGDVNLFFTEDDSAEINLMIAETEYRGKNYAQEAVELVIDYVRLKRPQVKKIVAKILQHNRASLRFFEKIGFVRVGEGEPNAFGEFIYERNIYI